MRIQSDGQKQSIGDRTSHVLVYANDPSSDSPRPWTAIQLEVLKARLDRALDSLIWLVGGNQPTAGVRLVGL